MAGTNEIVWPEKVGIGIRNRVLRLNFCIEKLVEKISQLVMVTEAWKERKPSSTIKLSVLKMELDDVKKATNEILIKYRNACDQNEVEKEDKAMKDLKELIIEVYKIKRNVDQKVKGLNELDPSQDLTAKEVGEHHDRKGKSLIVDDSDDVMKFDHTESSQGISFTELIKVAILTLSSSSAEEEITDGHEKKDGDVTERFLNKVSESFSLSKMSENNDDVEPQASVSNSGNDEKVKGLNELDPTQDLTEKEIGEHQDRKGKGLTINDSDDVMKFDHAESNQGRSFTELKKDAILTLSSGSTEEEIIDEHEKKDGDVTERFLNKVSESFTLLETSENNDDVEPQDFFSNSDDEFIGSVVEWEGDLTQMIIENWFQKRNQQ